MDGPYNIRIIEYENGTVEIRNYDKPVNAVYDGESSISPIYQKSKKRKKNLIENPFTGELEHLKTFDDAARSDRVSMNRTRNNVYKYSRQADWEYFITLTFDSTKVDRYDFDVCMKKSRKWLSNQQIHYAPDLKYLIVPEQHKDGAWHIHGVLACVGDMKITDSGRVSKDGKAYVRDATNCKYPTIYNLSGWKNGWSTATKVRDKHKVASYIVKYITKDLCSVTSGKHRYYKSNNIPEPVEHGFIVSPDDMPDFIQTLENSYGMSLVHHKKLESIYQIVSYRYYLIEQEREVKNEQS